MKPIRLDGSSLNRAQLAEIALGAQVSLDPAQMGAVQRAADFLAEQVRRQEPIYGVSTGFGSNADKLLGAHRLRTGLPGASTSSDSVLEELQHNLIVTHAVCVGEPFAPDVVRAMMAIRINTLMRGHSGIRPSVLQAMTDMLNAGIVPVVPRKGSVGASGDLAPLSHLAIVLLGGGEAFYDGERIPGAQALERAGLTPVKLSHKEGLALNNGTAQMLATRRAGDRTPGRTARHRRPGRVDDPGRLRRPPARLRPARARAAPASGAGARGGAPAPPAPRGRRGLAVPTAAKAVA